MTIIVRTDNLETTTRNVSGTMITATTMSKITMTGKSSTILMFSTEALETNPSAMIDDVHNYTKHIFSNGCIL